RPGTFLSEAFWIGNGSQWTHSSDHAEGRRQCHFPHGHLDRLPSTSSGCGAFAGSNEGSGGTVARLAGSDRCELRPQTSRPGINRFHAGLIGFLNPNIPSLKAASNEKT